MSKSSEIYFHNTIICLSRLHNSFDKGPIEAKTISLSCENTQLLQENKDLRFVIEKLEKPNNKEAELLAKPKGTLLIGSSMVKTVTDDFDLENTEVTAMSGGCIQDVSHKLETQMKNKKFENIVFVVGGNDCQSPREVTTILDGFNSLIVKGKSISEHVVVSSVFPRKGGPELQDKIDEVNNKLSNLCENSSCKYINQDCTFKVLDGTRNDVLYKDNVHLNKSGVCKMLSNLGIEFKEKSYAQAVLRGRSSNSLHEHQPSSGNRAWGQKQQHLESRTWRNMKQTSSYRTREQPTCHFCGIPGHMKDQCRHGDYLKCHTCKAYGHKSKYCKNYLVVGNETCADNLIGPSNISRCSNNVNVKNNGLRIASLNVHSLVAKFDEVRDLLFSHKLDILCLNETLLDETVLDKEICIIGYSLIRKDRTGHGGGVAIYFCDYIKLSVCNDLNNVDLELIWCRISPPYHSSFLLCCFYRSPSLPIKTTMECFLDNVSLASSTKQEIIIIGDLNIDCYSKNDKSNYIDIISNLYNMEQLITKPTRVTSSTSSLIDIILTTMSHKHQVSDILKVTLSDHFMIYTDVCYNVKARCKEITCRSFKNFDNQQFLDKLYVALLNLDTSMNLKELWKSFKDIFMSISNKHAPLRTYRIKGNSLPWINQLVIDAIKERDKLHEIAVKQKDEALFKNYRIARNNVTKLIRNEKRNYFNDKINNAHTMSNNELWKSVKMLLGNGGNESVPLELSSDEFNHFFTNIGSEINKTFTSNELYWRGPESIYSFKFNSISEDDLLQLLQKLPSKSNNDVIGLDSKLLNLAAHVICSPLCRIFNLSLKDGIVLEDWKTARVIPIFKGKGSKDDPKNYRPISVISHVAKLLKNVFISNYYPI